jgi:hypothetical protein
MRRREQPITAAEEETAVSEASSIWLRLNRRWRDWRLRRRARHAQRLLDDAQRLPDDAEEHEDPRPAAADVYSWLGRRDPW